MRASQDAAANLARTQIDGAYTQPQSVEQIASAPTEQTQPATQQLEAENPYMRTQGQSSHQIEQNAWQRYHSAWQNYYQQYYERYYMSEVDKTKKSLETSTHQPVTREPEVFTEDEALYDLRSKLLGTVQTKAKAVRKSRHFVPVVASLVVMFAFLFLQFNRNVASFFVAYVAPGSLSPESLDISPADKTAITKDDRIIIPKLNIDIPIMWNAVASDQNSLNQEMDKGAAWFNVVGANSRPGQNGNSVYSAHSSNDWLDQGEYKFAFAPLVRIKDGDMIYINYQGTRYAYTVSHTKTVQPTDVAALNEGADKPYMTLITCVPLGTALNRLLVFADQVSPNPAVAEAKPAQTTSVRPTAMPRNSPTLIERAFGIGG